MWLELGGVNDTATADEKEMAMSEIHLCDFRKWEMICIVLNASSVYTNVFVVADAFKWELKSRVRFEPRGR